MSRLPMLGSAHRLPTAKALLHLPQRGPVCVRPYSHADCTFCLPSFGKERYQAKPEHPMSEYGLVFAASCSLS